MQKPMRNVIALICAALFFLPAPSHAQRLFSQSELDALLAPVALYPNNVIAAVLAAATDPARRDLLPYPELRRRLAEDPGWARDLACAYAMQQGEIWRTVRLLRARAGPPPVAPPIAPPPQIVVVREAVPVIVVKNVYLAQRHPRNGPPSVAVQLQRQQQKPQAQPQPRHHDRNSGESKPEKRHRHAKSRS